MLVLASKDKILQRQIREYLSAEQIAAHGLILVRDESAWQKALSSERPRLVLLDDGVSPGSGLAWLTALRCCLPEALVVYIAERHSLELERAVRQLGVLYYTSKPPEKDSLGKVLATVLPAPVAAKDGSLHV